MSMSYNDLLNAIIDDGVEEVRQSYTQPNQQMKHDGAIRGFECCRGLTVEQLLRLYEEAKQNTITAQKREAPDYWYIRHVELQIGWILQVISAARYGQGSSPIPTIPVMSRALLKAKDILGKA